MDPHPLSVGRTKWRIEEAARVVKGIVLLQTETTFPEGVASKFTSPSERELTGFRKAVQFSFYTSLCSRNQAEGPPNNPGLLFLLDIGGLSGNRKSQNSLVANIEDLEMPPDHL